MEKLTIKDLIHVGIFTALYFAVLFAGAMLGYIPILFILLPVYLPVITALPFMLFLTRVKKFGMVSLMGLLLGMIMFATGHTFVPIVTGTICGAGADVIFKSGSYKKFSRTVIGYGVFSTWSMGAMLPIWIMRDSYLEYMRSNMGDQYVQAVITLTPDWVAFAVVAIAFVSGILGAYFGKRVLKKHFERAGIA